MKNLILQINNFIYAIGFLIIIIISKDPTITTIGMATIVLNVIVENFLLRGTNNERK